MLSFRLMGVAVLALLATGAASANNAKVDSLRSLLQQGEYRQVIRAEGVKIDALEPSSTIAVLQLQALAHSALAEFEQAKILFDRARRATKRHLTTS